MAEGLTGSLNSLSSLGQGTGAAQTQSKKDAKSGEATKTEFIQLLVTQLKNQDPLNPLENQEFAVQLAQFSQLEQLIGINDAISKDSGATDAGSLASYLGHQVVLNTNEIEVNQNDGGSIQFNLGSDAADVTAQLLNSEGTVIETLNFGALQAGLQTIELKDLAVASGSYAVKVVANTPGAGNLEPEVFAAGTVNGFIPGADPVLLLGQREISPADIKEVRSSENNG